MREKNFRSLVVFLLSVIAGVQILSYVAPISPVRAGDVTDVRVVGWRTWGTPAEVKIVDQPVRVKMASP